MQHEPGDTDPTTHREPTDDVEAHGLSGKKIPRVAEDVDAHWIGKPPIVDDVQAHGGRHGRPEATDADDVEAHGKPPGKPSERPTHS